MEQLAARIFDKIQSSEHGSRTFCDFPIKSICGMNVHLELSFLSLGASTKQVRIVIGTYDICYSENSETQLFFHTLETINRSGVDFTIFTIEKIMNYIKQMLEIIPTLRLDKLKSCLTQSDPIDTSYFDLFKFDNTELKYDICSVCHELCNTKTECKHPICIECVPRLDGYESDDEMTKRDCPLCRQQFKYICH
jgi:hypothetical protein